MFLRFTLLLLCLAVPSTVLGQVRIISGPNGPQVLPATSTSQSYNYARDFHGLRLPSQQPSGVNPITSYPASSPQGVIHNRIPGGWASPNVVTGINNQTLGLNTSSSQVDDSTFAFGREQGKANQQWVRRPVYGANGQVTGYQEGHVWRNPYTGQEHGNLKNYTPNNQGGVNTQVHTRMMRLP